MRVSNKQPTLRPLPGVEQTAAQLPTASARPAEPHDALSLQPAAPPDVAGCQGAWQQHLLVRIRDRDLAPAVEELFAYHEGCRFFGVRTQGMERITGVGPDGLDVQLAPNRNKVPLVEIREGDRKECALCRPPFPDERGLSWRGYNIWPNAFPYVPTEGRHVVITAARHVGQGYSPGLLEDMIDYQRLAEQTRPVTMHYNGIAGNSQFHLHWQATHETLPVQRLLDRGELPLEPLLAADAGRVDAFDHGFYTGLLVRGSKAFVSHWASILIDQLERNEPTFGAYNLLLLHPRDGQSRLVVIPRRADELKPDVPGFGRVGLGAFSLGGTIVVPRDSISQSFGVDVAAAADRTVVRPAQLRWLAKVMHQPTNPMLLARTAQTAPPTSTSEE